MKDFISQNREAVSARVQGSGKTALHIAADAGNMLIVEELVRLMSEKDLEVQQYNGATALSIAAVVGNTHMAKCMIEKNKRLLVIAGMFGYIPICDAFNHNHMQLGRYLYSVTPQEVLLSGEGMYAVVIITQSIYNKNNFDIALDLLPKIPPSAIVKGWGPWGVKPSPLLALACKPSAFYSGCRLMFWQRWIYHYVHINLSSWTNDIYICVQNLQDNQSTKKNIFGSGTLAPYAQLNRISGAALQMQRELQWFKEIEALVPPKCLEAGNKANKMTPRDLFTENHKDLVKEGEKWMKETATSCTVIGALIVIIMFTAAFTVPGGNDGDTVLMFLGVLTTRYAEEDFLKSLPSKLVLGLSTLFLSIATMMVSFSAALFIMLQTQSGILIPVILLASIPISLFAWMQFPLLVEIFMSTYGTIIFEHKVNRWLYPYK